MRRPRRMASADRIPSCERRARRGRVPFVEHEIEDLKDRVEPVRQFGPRGHLIRNPRVADLRLRTDDPLGDGRRAGQECVRDFLGRQAADLTQRQRHLGIGRQCRMAAREDQPQPVVINALFGYGRLAGHRLDLIGQACERRVEPRPAPDGVDCLESTCRDEPRPWIVGHAIARPLLHGGDERVVQRLLGEIEIAKKTDEGGKDATRFTAVSGVDRVAHLCVVFQA